MVENIIWRSHVKANKGLVESLIKKLEKEWNVKFPKEYVGIVTNFDIAMPYPKDNSNGIFYEMLLPMDNTKTSAEMISLKETFSSFFNCNISNIERVYNEFKRGLPKKVFPFAHDALGNFFLFDYRNSAFTPTISYIDRDEMIFDDEFSDEELEEKSLAERISETIHPVCSSFQEFLNSLEPHE